MMCAGTQADGKMKADEMTQAVGKITDLILLAAGDSKRYGDENKLLKLIDGKPMYQYGVDTLLTVQKAMPQHIGKIIVVSKYPEIEDYVKSKRDVTYKVNHQSELGISHSIHIGLKESKKNHNTLFFVCDQPHMKPDTICRLIIEFEKSEKKAGILLDEKKAMGNPCIFAPILRDKLERLSGDTGGKKVIRELSKDDCCFVEASAAQLLDIDYKN